ncbi:MAG: 2-C-methyl-D-erythritol 2,4-cyclodiphosphate synthase [Planctomycetes bacterium]|nr:2-C-methyl-D-erythritol 2,4-cyclodiphosphate synthase [Planctomycetota bacterium]MCB9824815.1 2-C-methyl-D-erythritol 2,4-cyclodiphosphate synthase [Planctomycetota bacterium]MCB9829293.1 2-C-methyl-D-erythritol 2,4-cyclodiphosphate synthase [Planctomycetota bacterium]MCB9901779.1 2-C-methyl-D-erythritol 2,4-cyclodiphosphate synthase [Planctomycetota bacterium]
MRVGIGYDVHPFEPGRTLVLGGVKVEGSWGLRGHSDADALLHAIGDALLGAAALGDLGDHFPDSDPQWKDVPSAVLINEILAKVRARGLEPCHVDATVVAERPRLAPYRSAMVERIASLLGLETSAVNVKATTHEGLGALGRGEGIAAMAVASLREAGA